MRALIYLIFALVICACTSGDAPEVQWEMALQGVYSATLSSEGRNAVIGSVHHGGSFWQVKPKERLFDWNHEAEKKTGIVTSAISDDGRRAATSEHRKIVLWNAKTGEAFWLWEAPANIQDMDLNEDGSMALLGLESYEAALFDIQNGGVKQRLSHDGIVQSVDMTPDMKWAITGGDDSLVKVWDLATGKPIHQWELNNQIKSVAISRDGLYGFASSHRGITRMWNLRTGKVLAEFPKISGHYRAARFDRAGTKLLTGTSSGQVHLWSVPKGVKKRTWHMPPRNSWVTQNTQVLDVSFSGKGYRAVGANGIVYHYQ